MDWLEAHSHLAWSSHHLLGYPYQGGKLHTGSGMNPFAVLGLEDTASPDEVKARWRSLASEHHPDNGGNAERFDECRKA